MKTSLVVQTRLGWVLVALLLISTLILSALAMSSIQQTQRTLSDTAIPKLSNIESISEETTKLNQAFDELARATDHQTRAAGLDRAYAAIERTRSLGQQDEQILGLLSKMASSLNQVALVGAKALKTRDQIRSLQTKVVTHEDDLGERIAILNAETGLRIEALILTEPEQTDTGKLATGIHDLNTSVQIKTMFDRELDLTVSLLSVQSHIELGELEKRIAFNLRAIINSLISLTDNNQKKALAQSIKALRDDLLGDSGLIALERERIDFEQELQSGLSVASGILQEISAHANRGVTEAQAEILQSAASIDKTVNRTIVWLAVLAIVIVAMVFPATLFFIERRVVLRLAELARSVREISAGNTDWKVTVTGQDEFGEMACALETFKSNLMELRRSNEELGRFAYAASHDLKSPLRAIHDLAQWTIEDVGDSLPGEGLENLTMIIKRSERLSNLLNDLLDYSRVGREEHAIENIDLVALTKEISEMLGASESFDISVTGNTSVAKTYLAPLRQILLNFITNAVKHHDRREGKIIVDFCGHGSRLQISVADDGPGISPEFHERIFDLFQTLKSRDEVEGSGMGLAIIRKQVEQYDGHIAVLSDPGTTRGTTFVFDWPRQISEKANPMAA